MKIKLQKTNFVYIFTAKKWSERAQKTMQYCYTHQWRKYDLFLRGVCLSCFIYSSRYLF